ncbi:MAG TPA: hypothetical protein VGW10_05030 [Solirubrobacteraceae bacterium]|nr:hypothetical protein [Solirubrobacteraceae bacterium]
MGYHSPGRRSRPGTRLSAMEIVCAVLVVAAIAGLVAWIIANAGGGHFVF